MEKPNALGISADDFRAIEQTRQRLFQLSNSIQGLKMDVLKSNPLPPPYVYNPLDGLFISARLFPPLV